MLDDEFVGNLCKVCMHQWLLIFVLILYFPHKLKYRPTQMDLSVGTRLSVSEIEAPFYNKLLSSSSKGSRIVCIIGRQLNWEILLGSY